MVTKEDRELLDYLYSAGQKIQKYLRSNGYNEFDHNSFSIDVSIDHEDAKYDKVTAWVFTSNRGEKLRGVKKEFRLVSQKPEYKEV